MNKDLFAEKIAHYARREPKYFLQLDGHYLPHGGDEYTRTDADGDAVTADATVELMHGSTVRVLIPHDADPRVAARQLKKISKWFKCNPNLLDCAKPKPEKTPVDFDNEIPF